MTSNPSQSIFEKHSMPMAILKIDSIESKNTNAQPAHQQQKNNNENVVVTDKSILSTSNQPSVFTTNSVATKVKLFNVSN